MFTMDNIALSVAEHITGKLYPIRILTQIDYTEKECFIILLLDADDFRAHWQHIFLTVKAEVPFATLNWSGIDLEVSFTNSDVANYILELQ